MPAAALPQRTGLLLPALLLAVLGAAIVTELDLFRLPRTSAVALPETVTIAPRAYSYRATGEFLRDGRLEDGPLVAVDNPQPLEIMTFEVTVGEYQRCVTDGACRPVEPRRGATTQEPVTGVSFEDARAYAGWLSAATGATWRLPTVAEWTFAAGEQATDPALDADTDAANPAQRWLATYAKESALKDGAPATPAPRGTFGVNAFGVADMDGPVWEWTATCASRTTYDTAGAVVSQLDSCGVRFLEGRHRAAMNIFVRDARTGGCSFGAAPDNLGFRLVRDRG